MIVAWKGSLMNVWAFGTQQTFCKQQQQQQQNIQVVSEAVFLPK